MLSSFTELVTPGGATPGGATLQGASIENPSVSLSDPAAWKYLTDGEPVASGVRVSRTRALAVPAVWQAISVISGDVAKLPLDLFREQADGDRDKQTQHQVHRLIRRKPNREMTAFIFWRRMMTHLLLWGNAYAVIDRRGDGTPLELLPLCPDRTEPVRRRGELVYESEIAGEVRPFRAWQIFHLEGLSIDGLAGFDFLRAAREALGQALAAQKFASLFFKNGARVGGILELPAAMPKGTRDKVEEGFRRSYENPTEAFKTVILREGAKFHAAQQSFEATQMVETSRERVRDVARYFNIRPSKLGEDSGGGYGSKAEDNRDYLDSTLAVHLVQIAAQANDKLLSEAERDAGYYVEHNTAALLQADFGKVVDALTKLRAAEIISPNEARQRLNMNRRADPEGDQYKNPNTRSAGQGTPPTEPTADPTTADERSARIDQANARLLAGALARISGSINRRALAAAKSAAAFCAWLDDLDSCGDLLRLAATPILEAQAANRPALDAAAAARRLAEATVDELRPLLASLADRHTLKDLPPAIERTLDDFAQARCLTLAAAALNPENPTDEVEQTPPAAAA